MMCKESCNVLFGAPNRRSLVQPLCKFKSGSRYSIATLQVLRYNTMISSAVSKKPDLLEFHILCLATMRVTFVFCMVGFLNPLGNFEIQF